MHGTLPLPWWERIQNRGLSAAKSQILLVRGSSEARYSEARNGKVRRPREKSPHLENLRLG